MSDKSIHLTQHEQGTLTELLLDAKKDRIKHKTDYSDIDRVIDKVSGRITLSKRSPKRHITLYDGSNYHTLYQGGQFKSEHGIFSIQEISDDNIHIKVNDHWHHKGEFEPATVIEVQSIEHIHSPKGYAR